MANSICRVFQSLEKGSQFTFLILAAVTHMMTSRVEQRSKRLEGTRRPKMITDMAHMSPELLQERTMVFAKDVKLFA